MCKGKKKGSFSSCWNVTGTSALFDNMNQPEQENKSLVLELNKYLSHWKALGLFSQHVQRSTGGRCSSSRGAEVLQEAFVRAGRVLGGLCFRGEVAVEGCLLLLRCLCHCFQRLRSDAGAGARPVPAAALPFLLLASSAPFPKAPCAASPLPQLPWDTGAASPASLRILLKPPCWRRQPGLRGRGGE